MICGYLACSSHLSYHNEKEAQTGRWREWIEFVSYNINVRLPNPKFIKLQYVQVDKFVTENYWFMLFIGQANLWCTLV